MTTAARPCGTVCLWCPTVSSPTLSNFFIATRKRRRKPKKKKEKEERKSKRQETLTDAMFSQGSCAVPLMEHAIIFLRLGTFCSCSDTQKVYNTR